MSRKPGWTGHEEQRLTELKAAGWTFALIAVELGRRESTVRDRWKSMQDRTMSDRVFCPNVKMIRSHAGNYRTWPRDKHGAYTRTVRAA